MADMNGDDRETSDDVDETMEVLYPIRENTCKLISLKDYTPGYTVRLRAISFAFRTMLLTFLRTQRQMQILLQVVLQVTM